MKQRSITTINFNITLITTLHETTTNHFLVTNALLSVNLQGMSFQQIRRHWIIDIIFKILRGRETGWWKAKETWYLYKVINLLNVSLQTTKICPGKWLWKSDNFDSSCSNLNPKRSNAFIYLNGFWKAAFFYILSSYPAFYSLV